MLSSLAAPILLLSWSGGALALPAAAADDCTTFPSWTIKDFRSSSSDTVGNDGTAEFTLINNLDDTSDDLTCTLEANYRCTIVGTPTDANLTVTIAIRSASLTLTLDKVLECPDRTSCVTNSCSPVLFPFLFSLFRWPATVVSWAAFMWVDITDDRMGGNLFRPLHAIANADLELGCTSAKAGETYTCSLDEDTVKGEAVELAPDDS